MGQQDHKNESSAEEKIPNDPSNEINGFEFQYDDKIINVLAQDYSQSKRHHTRNYKIALDVINRSNIKQLPIRNALDFYFNKYALVSDAEKDSIDEIYYCEKSRIIVFRMGKGVSTFENRNDLAKKTGWYFYVTGKELKESLVSLYVDKIKDLQLSGLVEDHDSVGENKKESKTIVKTIKDLEDIGKVALNLIPTSINESNETQDNSALKIDIGGTPYKFEFEIEYFEKNFDELGELNIINIRNNPNENSFFLELDDFGIVLDLGVSWREFNNYFNAPIQIEGDSGTESLDLHNKIIAAFISHAHYDHSQGFKLFRESFKNTPIFLSYTTLDFLVYILNFKHKNSNYSKKMINKLDKDSLETKDAKLIENCFRVKNLDKIPINLTSKGGKKEVGYIQFFFAGHVPGSLMFYIKYFDKDFLYTGDFTFRSYDPIPGVVLNRNKLPRNINFILADGSFVSEEFFDLHQQLKTLNNFSKYLAEKKRDNLIIADSSSTALIIFNDLHHFFIHLKERGALTELRPKIYMNNDVLEYAKIICMRIHDLNTSTKKQILKQFNPFSSGLIRWLKTDKDKRNMLSEIRTNNKLRKSGNIIIYDHPGLDRKDIIDIFSEISRYRGNSVYISGRLDSQATLELVSGENRITLVYFDYKSHKQIKKVVFNRALIQNRLNPKSIIILHADFRQLYQLVNIIRPKEIGFFHVAASKIFETRNILSRLKFIKRTYNFYKNEHKRIKI
ncbi:MAG: hypothetical protein ACTSU2_17435 [Promethearchaeota archaeon]